MLDWIKNIKKEYPEFWKDYISKFDAKPSRFVVLSLETSGIDVQTDSLLSIGAVAVFDNKIIVNDAFEITLSEDYRVDIEQFIQYVGNSILIGHRINFEIEMINELLEKMQCGRLKNEALDIEIMHQKLMLSEKNYPIDNLLEFYNIEKSDKNAAIEEAFSIALLFLKLKMRLKL